MVRFRCRIVVSVLAVFAATLTQSPAATPDVRVGYFLPSVRNVQLAEIPRRDRYATTIAENMAAAASITAVMIPAHLPGGLDPQALCKSMNLVGFIDPYVGWNVDGDTASAQAQAVVMDCHAVTIFQGQDSDTAKRDAAGDDEPQADARMAVASRRLAQQFAGFISANPAVWSAFRAGDPPAPLSRAQAAIAPLTDLQNCSAFFNMKRYVQAIGACNEANVAANLVPAALTSLTQKRPSDQTRSLTLLLGLMVASSSCLRAEAHYALAEPAAGLAQATDCEAWVKRLTPTIKAGELKTTDARTRQIAELLTAIGLIVDIHYPQLSSR